MAEYYSKKWTRKFSPNRGDYLKVEDEVIVTSCWHDRNHENDFRWPQLTEGELKCKLWGKLLITYQLLSLVTWMTKVSFDHVTEEESLEILSSN